MGLIEREEKIDAEIAAKQKAAGWGPGAHIGSVAKIDWRTEALSLEAQLAGAVDLIRRFAEHDLPGNPPDALLALFIAAEDFTREHDTSGGQ
jgi:hypothetical protein